MTNRRRIIGCSVLGVSAITWACSLVSTSDRSLAVVRSTGTIRIGYAVEAPFAFVKDGEITGESPDVAKRVVEAMGVPAITWVQTTFDRLITELQERRFDVIASGMFITDQRRQVVAFSHPTFVVRQALLVRAGNPRGLHAYDDIVALPEARVAVVSSSFERDLLEHAGVTGDRLVQVPDSLTGRVAVESGLVDALALSSITIVWLAQRDAMGRTEVATPFRQPTRGHVGGASVGGFAFRLADVTLRDAWNAALATFVGTEEHLRVIAPYGFTRDELPAPVAGQGGRR